MHVFIHAGLLHVCAGKKQASILEIGLGTGLNALLTWREALDKALKINYTALEKHPLPQSITKLLNYPDFLERQDLSPVFRKIHLEDAFSLLEKKATFHFRKQIADVRQLDAMPGMFDVVYFDAFAPSSQQEMWDPDLLLKIREGMLQGGVLVTYCAKGQFRRDLESLGFSTERIPGPPGKREMIRAVKL